MPNFQRNLMVVDQQIVKALLNSLTYGGLIKFQHELDIPFLDSHLRGELDGSAS